MSAHQNVVDRLRDEIQQAKRLGFQVRIEPLEDGQPGWCQMGNKRLLFLDAAQTAAEQLSQLSETLQEYRRQTSHFSRQVA